MRTKYRYGGTLKVISKSTFKTINKGLDWTIRIILISAALYHFFVHKISLKGLNFIIFWSLIGLNNLFIVIDAKFFEDDFTIKENRWSIFMIAMSIIFVTLELILPFIISPL